MKKIYKRYLLFLIAALAIISIANALVNKAVNTHYSHLVLGTDIVQAVQSRDKARIAAAANQNNLAYQEYHDGQLAYASRSGLPAPKLIRYNARLADDILQSNRSISMLAMSPHKVLIDNSLYLMFPACAADCRSDAYLLYSKVLP